MKPVYTSSEAARRLGISKSTLIRAVRRGDFQAAYTTPGRHLRFTMLEIEQIKGHLLATGRSSA